MKADFELLSSPRPKFDGSFKFVEFLQVPTT